MAETTARPRKQRDGSTPRHPQGRHHELDRVIRVAADGEQVTVEADALTRIATGIPLIQAAGALGIRRQTIHEWRRRGVRARARQIAGETITEPDELRLIAFADKCDAAEDRGYSTEWTRHGTVAAGGLEKVTVTTRQVVGPEGEVVTLQDRKVETTLPDPRAIQWRMAVRYGVTERMRVELTGAGGGPVEMELDVVDARAASVARRFGEFLEASASEVAAPDLATTPPGRVAGGRHTEPGRRRTGTERLTVGDLMHIERPNLPWRAERMTECGLDADRHPTWTRDAAVAKARGMGRQRFSLFVCMTCMGTAERHATWEEDPASCLGRYTDRYRLRWNPADDDRRRFADELRAVGLLVEARRERAARRMGGR
jgi:hypothetical protein